MVRLASAGMVATGELGVSSMTRRRFLLGLAGAGFSAGALAALTACGAQSAPATTVPPANATSRATTPRAVAASPTLPAISTATARRGGTIQAAQQGDWQGYDPHNQNSSSAYGYIYDALVNWVVQPDGSVKAGPSLATEWELTDKTATFKLRQGIKFHDGSDWNAGCAKFNIDRMLAPTSSSQANVASVASAEVVDPFTLRLNLKAAAAGLLANLSDAANDRAWMISQAMAEKTGNKYGTSPETTAGTGPMRVVEWVAGSHQVLQRTGTYWQQGGDGQPLTYIDTLRVRFIADDTVRAVELRSGNVQIIGNVQPKDMAALQRESTVEVRENPYQVTAYQFTFTSKPGPFADNLKLRQAIHYGIDRRTIAKVLGTDVGAPMFHFLTAGYVGYDESLPFYDFDLAKAKQLLGEAGYPSGMDLGITLINRAVDTQQGQILKQMLEAVGFRVALDSLERLAFNEKVKTGEFQMATYQTGVRPDSDSILGGRFGTASEINIANMSDPVMDGFLARGRGSYDDKVRAAAYRDVQRRIYETAKYGTIWYRKYFDAQRKDLQGRTPSQNAEWGLKQAWLAR